MFSPLPPNRIKNMPPKFKFAKDDIIAAGLEIVRHGGWRAFTARSLADALGSSPRPIYSYFNAMEQIEEEIVKRAVDLLHEEMTRTRTGAPWIDHGIGYVMFAHGEKHLFLGVNDENHIHLFKQYGDCIWHSLTAVLSDDPLFRGLTVEQIDLIQATRWLFAHGLAFQLCNPPPGIWTDEKIIEMMQTGSMAIYDGLIQKFGATKA